MGKSKDLNLHQPQLRTPSAIWTCSGSPVQKLHPDPNECSPLIGTFSWEVLITVKRYFLITNFGKFQSSSVCKGPVEGRDSKKGNVG